MIVEHGSWHSRQLPDVRRHVVTGNHPQGVVEDEDAGGMTRRPGSGGHLRPVHAVLGMPYIIAVSISSSESALHDPHATVENSHVVVLTRRPRRIGGDAIPLHSVGAAPNVVVKNALRLLRRVVGATAQNPDPFLENGAPADHPAWRPRQVVGDLGPIRAVGGVPHVAVKDSLRGREMWHGLTPYDPDLVVQRDRVMQYALPPRHIVADLFPLNAVGAVPNVI